MFGLLECQLEIASPNLLFDILILNSGHLLKIFYSNGFQKWADGPRTGEDSDMKSVGQFCGRKYLRLIL